MLSEGLRVALAVTVDRILLKQLNKVIVADTQNHLGLFDNEFKHLLDDSFIFLHTLLLEHSDTIYLADEVKQLAIGVKHLLLLQL